MPPVIDPTTGLQPTSTTFYNANTTGTTGQTGTTGSNQANAYTPGQQQLQQLLPSALQGIITGQQNVPSSFTAPQQVFDAYHSNFNQAEPGMVAQYGAGSPQIGSQRSLGDQQLAASLYQTGQGNYLNYLNSAQQGAYTPVGSASNANVNYNWQNDSRVDGSTGDSIYGSILSQLLHALGGLGH